MSLAVIGAGYPRTGTLSLKVALEELGLGPCHHMQEVFRTPRLQTAWERVFSGDAVDWDDVFQGYGATVDAPACYVYDRLMQRYPDARVVLSVRDPDRWFDSMASTILSEGYLDTLMASPVGPMLAKMLPFAMGLSDAPAGTPAGPLSRELMIAAYHAHVEKVRRAVPADRLLVYQVSEGWAPLCHFLGVPEPATTFPRVNDSASFHQTFAPSTAVAS